MDLGGLTNYGKFGREVAKYKTDVILYFSIITKDI